MAIQQFTRAAQIAYEETIKSRRGVEIDSILYPIPDVNEGAEVELDQHLQGAITMRTVKQGAPANVQQLEAGTRTSHVPPVHAEKVIVDPRMRDEAIAGVPATNWRGTMDMRINQILNGPAGFVERWLAARRAAALSVLETGQIKLVDSESNSAVEYNFNRNSALTFNYDPTATDNSFDGAVLQWYNAARKFYLPPSGLALILGAKWLAHFDSSDTVIKKREAQQAQELVRLQMVPPEFRGVEGLNVLASYRVDGMSQPVLIMSYEPNQLLLRKAGGTPAPYVPDNKMLAFSLNSNGYRFYRGVDILAPDGQSSQRVAGGLVLDSFVTQDPVADVFRAQSRFLFMPGNVNHTGCITGTNI